MVEQEFFFDTIERGPDDLAAILYTSGTTGKSKGAILSHQNLLSNTKVLKDYWKFTKEDVLLHMLPIYHTHGLFVASNFEVPLEIKKRAAKESLIFRSV